MKKQELLRKINKSSIECQRHAESCRECFHPIMDEEGNPQYVGEACEAGAKLLTEYRRLESEYFK